jgi:hypothetical protein
MKLLREIPEYEKKLKDGLVNETNLCMIQAFFNHEEKFQGEAYSKEKKMDILKEAEGLVIKLAISNMRRSLINWPISHFRNLR